AALRFFAGLRRDRFRALPGITVAQLVHGQPLVEQLWEPICLAALNTPMAQASAQVFLNVLREAFAGRRAASDLLFPRSDLDQLFPRPARAFVERHGGDVRMGAVVTALTARQSGFQL